MPVKHAPFAPALTQEKHLKTLIENRSVYSLNSCELNIFETHQHAEKVALTFDSLVFTAMFRGKKIMHLKGLEPFDYLPGESVIVPEHETMIIDFPEAEAENPTQCLALAIEEEKIKETLDTLNYYHAKVEAGDWWHIDNNQQHLKNSREITTTIDRLVAITKEDNHAKDIFANFTLQELLIRLMQTQARNLLMNRYKTLSSTHRFAFIINHVKENLHRNITIDELAKLACMSKPSFFRSFKNELGISPNEFIIRERISLAKSYLKDARCSIADAAYRSGFNNISYFTQIFRKYAGHTPAVYKQSRVKIA
jgi:AraC-like DNA-binding protein